MPQASVDSLQQPNGAELERHRAALWRYARVLGAEEVTADDLVQETMLVLLQRRGFDAGEPAAVFTFLRTTLRHRWLKHVRRTMTRQEVEHADEVWREECGDGDGDEYIAALRACVAALPKRGRTLLEHAYQRGLGRADSARLLGISEHTIKSSLRRLRDALRACIERRRRRET